MNFQDPQVIIAFSISNVVALLMLLMSWKKPAIARLLYGLLFIWASWFNSTTALYAPQLYLDYGTVAFLPFYRDFIYGLFSAHILFFVITIAVCQFAIGISMLMKGGVFRLGAIGGIIFLVSIAPLGVGAAFPATLVMAAGLFLLLQKKVDTYLWQAFRKKIYVTPAH